MTPYFLVFSSLFFFQLLFKRKGLMVGGTVLIALFFCFSYMNGSDWRQYELVYEGSYQKSLLTMEPGFLLLLNVFKYLGVDFWHFFILVKLICFYFFAIRLYSYVPNNYFNALALFLSFFGLFLFIDCPLRNLIAVTIALYSIPYLLNRDFRKFILVVILAALFHVSSLALLILYFFSNMHATKGRLIFSYIAFYAGLVILSSILKSGIISFFEGIPFIGSKLAIYFAEDNEASEGNVFTLGLLLRSILYIILVLNKDSIIKKYGLTFFNQIVVFFFLYRLSVTFPIFMRFTLFYSIFFTIGTTMLFNVYSLRYRPVVYILFYFYLFSSMYTLITSSYKYVPYTNYLEYLNEEKPSYNERFRYNFDQSPYHKKR